MSDGRLRGLERAAATGGLLDRLALDTEILRQLGGVDHPGPSTSFATLALFLADPFDERNRRTDPRDDPAFRALLADAGEWEHLRVWAVSRARLKTSSRTGPGAPRLTWCQRVQPVADEVERLTEGWPEAQRRTVRTEANPYGRQTSWGRKAWLRAVRLARGLKPTPDRRRKVSVEPTSEMFS